jgi:hypothetical protein
MLTCGENITMPNDPLLRIPEDSIMQRILHPADSFAEQIRKLRMIRTLDETAYKRQKLSLPYIVCSIFHPLYRKKENFASATALIIDLDHCSQAGFTLSEIKDTLRQDPQVYGAFVSPGGDGLKVLFRLKEPVSDAGLFSTFYKSFLLAFCQKYPYETMVDFRTHDVTRACFLSADPEAIFHPGAESIHIADYVKEDAPDEQYTIEKALDAIKMELPLEAPPKKELPDDILAAIKSRLKPNAPAKPPGREVYVPDELQPALEKIRRELSLINMQILAEESIQYGKKLRIGSANIWAEVNIFFGKKGYSVVKTTKTGSHIELGSMVQQLLVQWLCE